MQRKDCKEQTEVLNIESLQVANEGGFLTYILPYYLHVILYI